MTGDKMPLSESAIPQLTTDQRLPELGMLEAGFGHLEVTSQFGFRQGTIPTLLSHFWCHWNMNDEPRFVRPKVTTRIQDRCIHIQNLQHRFRAATMKWMRLLGCITAEWASGPWGEGCVRRTPGTPTINFSWRHEIAISFAAKHVSVLLIS